MTKDQSLLCRQESSNARKWRQHAWDGKAAMTKQKVCKRYILDCLHSLAKLYLTGRRNVSVAVRMLTNLIVRVVYVTVRMTTNMSANERLMTQMCPEGEMQ